MTEGEEVALLLGKATPRCALHGNEGKQDNSCALKDTLLLQLLEYSLKRC